jgi:S-adenosylmethionine:tRNA-ribosyltransferase-isomerase (queuine synthetase)
MIDKIRIEDFTYDLPEERIAKFPLENRDDSKLLVRTKSTGYLPTEEKFRDVIDFLPKDAFMVFNNTKVVPARLFFRRETGAHIEIFCLEPHDPVDYAVCFAQTERCCWKVIVGNVKRWKNDVLSFDDQGDESLSTVDLKARLVSREGNSAIVEFSWKGGDAFPK